MVDEVLKVPAGEWLLQTAAASVLGRQVIQVGCCLIHVFTCLHFHVSYLQQQSW